MQLPAAALGLLAALAARDAAVRSWLVAECDRCVSASPTCTPTPHPARQWLQQHHIRLYLCCCRLLLPLLPLAFHSLHSVRRAAARLLAIVALGGEAGRWSGFAAASGGGLLPAGASEPRLPAPLLAQLRLPFAVAAVPVASEQEGGVVFMTDQRQDLQALVHQQRLMRAVHGDPEAALQLLDSDLGAAGLPQALAATTTATLRALCAPALARSLLAAVAAADAHASCAAALAALQRLAATQQGMAAVAAEDWVGSLARLLAAAPATEDDGALWTAVLALVERLVASGAEGATWGHHTLQLAPCVGTAVGR